MLTEERIKSNRLKEEVRRHLGFRVCKKFCVNENFI